MDQAAPKAATSSRREPTEKWSYEKLMATLRHLKGDEINGPCAEGATWTEDQAVAAALKI
jgi:hypothetical protein